VLGLHRVVSTVVVSRRLLDLTDVCGLGEPTRGLLVLQLPPQPHGKSVSLRRSPILRGGLTGRGSRRVGQRQLNTDLVLRHQMRGTGAQRSVLEDSRLFR